MLHRLPHHHDFQGLSPRATLLFPTNEAASFVAKLRVVSVIVEVPASVGSLLGELFVLNNYLPLLSALKRPNGKQGMLREEG